MFGSSFVFNFYCHWSSLVLRNGNGTSGILQSIEGVTQRDPLAMITYRIVILPLINNLKREIPDVTQTWYADYAGVLGTFARLDTYFDLLTQQGLGRGYHLKPSKSVLIVRLENLEPGKSVWSTSHICKITYEAADASYPPRDTSLPLPTAHHAQYHE